MRVLISAWLLLTSGSLPAQLITPAIEVGFVRTIQVIDGDVWIGSELGAFTMRRGSFEPVTDRIRVSAVAKFDDQIWLGTEQGLLAFSDGAVRRIYESALGSLSVVSFVEDGDRILVGTNKGLFIVQSDGARLTEVRDPVLEVRPIANEIYISTRRNLYLWNEGAPSPLSAERRTFLGVSEGAGSVWATTLSVLGLPGPVFRVDSGSLSKFDPLPSRQDFDFGALSISELYGEVYFGTTRGLQRLSGEHLDLSYAGGPMEPINTIVPFQDGMLLGTTRGLYRQEDRDGEFRPVGVEGGEAEPAAMNVKTIAIQGERVVWLGTYAGVFRVDFRPATSSFSNQINRGLLIGGLVILLVVIFAAIWLYRGRRSPSLEG